MVECPTCEDEFNSEKGMKMHHAQVHDESIAGYEHECEWCGGTFRSPRSPNDEKAPKYCPSTENEKGCYAKSMEGENNPNKDPERKEKISKGMEEAWEEGVGNLSKHTKEWMMENVINKRDDSYLYQEPSEETKKKLSEAQKELVERGEHHLQDPEVRKKIVETRNKEGTWEWYPDISPEEAQKLAAEVREDYGPKKCESELTGRILDSSWELEVDEMLHREDFEYIRNTDEETVEFELEYGRHIPDFIVREGQKPVVIEVKGWMGYHYNEEKAESFAKEMTERDDIFYILYGDMELKSDAYVEYGNEEALKKTIEKFVN